jgi:hypothetical protein
MFTKIKEFLFGKPTQLEAEIKSEVPYKVEATAPKIVAPVTLGTEASISAAPVAKKKAAAPKVPAKPKAPPKPRTTKTSAK